MTRHLHRSLAVVGAVLGLLPAGVLAQQPGTTISGRVTSDAQTPLPGVSVSIAAYGAGGYTDAQGRYSFTVSSARAVGRAATITARRIGFEPKTATVTLGGSPISQDFVLVPTA